MKKLLFTLFLFSSFIYCHASHIVGGEIYYTYIGPGANAGTSKYTVTMRLFTECGQICGGNTTIACPPTSTIVGVFINTAPYTRVLNLILPRIEQINLNLTTYSPCLTSEPVVCYTVNVYSTTVELQDNAVGYRLTYQNCCRAEAVNVSGNAQTISGQPGDAFETLLPGTNQLATHNSNAIVNLKDTALICYGTPFSLDFGSTDADGDSLSYEFIAAYNGGSFQSAHDNVQPDNPLYKTISYTSGYSGASPLGPGVTINHQNGTISGIAPSKVGEYDVNVLVKEWRNGRLIAEHRKDFLITVNQCTLPKALLNPLPVTCDGFNVSFKNDGPSTNINTWFWDFGVPSLTNDTSILANPTYTYPDSGTFLLKLVINKGTPCKDSASTLVKVYPGFFPDFLPLSPACTGVPVQFKDATTTKYGVPTGWRWNFGNPIVTNDTSVVQNPTYIYPTPGTYNVQLVVSNTKGCIDSLFKDIVIRDPLPLTITNDTLICIIDTLKLTATGNGNILWSPDYNISSLTSHTPLVSPDVITKYTAKFTDALGCISYADVSVDVRSDIFVDAGNDTTICQTDTIRLHAKSEALQYNWTPVLYLSDANTKNPAASPLSTQKYHVTANLGKCQKEDDVTVTVVPYPSADAGKDERICFGSSAQLNATGGSKYIWSPADFLNATNIPNPISVKPIQTTQYVVTVTDELGCPKAVNDTVVINVIRVIANAGPSDTSIVINEPLFLNATGGDGDIYQWSPSTWLDNPGISNPVGRPQNDIVYTVLVKSIEGCFDTDSIKVKIYRVPADLYVPTAFTPNNDGLNDQFSPVLLGIRRLSYFRIYNRWGELVFSTTQHGKGWDGTYHGDRQNAGNYIWMTEGITYEGKTIQKKGNVILIR